MNFQHGRNSQNGKRKRGTNPSLVASKLSRKLFFKGGRPATAQISPLVFDRAVGRALKSRHIATPEQKFFDAAVTAGTVSATPVITLLNGIAQGDTEGTRTAEKITITKIQVLGFIRLGGANVIGAERGKLTLFIDKQANGAAPGYSSASGVVSALYTPAAYPFFKNPGYDDAFYIVKELDFILDANAGVSGAWQNDCFNFKWDVPITRVVRYNAGNAGTVADIVTNAIYLGYQSVTAAGGADVNAYITFRTRVWYTDA